MPSDLDGDWDDHDDPWSLDDVGDPQVEGLDGSPLVVPPTDDAPAAADLEDAEGELPEPTEARSDEPTDDAPLLEATHFDTVLGEAGVEDQLHGDDLDELGAVAADGAPWVDASALGPEGGSAADPSEVRQLATELGMASVDTGALWELLRHDDDPDVREMARVTLLLAAEAVAAPWIERREG